MRSRVLAMTALGAVRLLSLPAAALTIYSGGYVVEPVGRGEVELGVHQITEILPVESVKLVGPLPAPLQKETVYVGAVAPGSAQATEARTFLAHLRSPEVRGEFATRGFIE
jgi:molybdate transport system substrate-binding protein